jgi:hypothetical protein
MSSLPAYTKKSVTIPTALLHEIRPLMPDGNLSACVTKALRREMEQYHLGSLVDEFLTPDLGITQAEVTAWEDKLA